MHADLENLGWTEEQWNRICATVTEEAQKARVAAQALPVCGPEDPSTVAVPTFRLQPQANQTLASHLPQPAGPAPPGLPPTDLLYPVSRLAVDSDPTLYINSIAVNVQLRGHEMADPELRAGLTMFRRAANILARVEDALIFNGRPAPNAPPGFGVRGIPNVYQIHGDGLAAGIFVPLPWMPNRRIGVRLRPPAPPALRGDMVVDAVVKAIDVLEQAGQLGPYACFLANDLFEDICRPTPSLVLPRDRILPFLLGPLLRSSTIVPSMGVVVALSASPVELVVASDIGVRFLQTTTEPRYVFRVSERVALRIKEDEAIAIIS
jgi:uncharacterized linocin/CFP29 family protein